MQLKLQPNYPDAAPFGKRKVFVTALLSLVQFCFPRLRSHLFGTLFRASNAEKQPTGPGP
jgi:hypothetical protein